MPQSESSKPNALALLPFFVFAIFYAGLSIWAGDFYRVPMIVAFLTASAVAVGMNRKRPLSERIDIYSFGMGETNIMMMCLIFILSGAFATVAKGSGAVDAAVALAQSLVPSKIMVAGVFVISSVISLAIGTSCGTIAAVSPIALGFAAPLGLSPAFLLGAVVSGAMFGDNLSMISDTTIAATRTQGVEMRDKFFANAAIAVPPAVLAVAIYAITGSSRGDISASAFTAQNLLLVTPYVLILVLALVGFNVMMLLFLGTCFAAVVGCALGKFGVFDALDLMGKGTLGMSETLIVAILAGGLFRIVQYNGGIACLTGLVMRIVKGPRTCELAVAILVGAVNVFTANNTVAIVITGPIARECAASVKANAVRIASVLDTASCIVQGVIPYGAQILIALGVANGLSVKVGAFDLIRRLYYQPILAGAVLISIFFFGSGRRLWWNGRHAGFRFPYGNMCGFKSHQAHQRGE